MEGTKIETAKIRLSLVKKLSGLNEPTTYASLMKYGMDYYDSKATIIALTRSYCKKEDGFELPQTFKNKNGYLTLVCDHRSNSYFKNLSLAITLERRLLIARREIKKDILNK